MTPEINHSDVAHDLRDPYRAGCHVQADVFARQLIITCHGELEFLEDATYGLWWMPTRFPVGECGLIEEAISLAEDQLRRGDLLQAASSVVSDRSRPHGIGPGCHSEPLGFEPQRFVIRDRSDRLVLAGEVRERRIAWCRPVATDLESGQVSRKVQALRDEASSELGWDNAASARLLRLQADLLEGRQVSPFWRDHVLKVFETMR